MSSSASLSPVGSQDKSHSHFQDGSRCGSSGGGSRLHPVVRASYLTTELSSGLKGRVRARAKEIQRLNFWTNCALPFAKQLWFRNLINELVYASDGRKS